MNDGGPLNESYDVVVIGGGAAGLSGAVALARSRRSVLVADAGEHRNSSAGHVHNFLTRDGTPPGELYAAGRAEVVRYGGRVEVGRVTSLSRDGELFRARLNGRAVAARRLLVATGLRDELPDVPGLAQRWGVDVLHCPYCHGWEVRDKQVGILATGAGAIHQALLFRQLTSRVTVLRHTAVPFAAEQAEQLSALGIPVIDGIVAEVEAPASRLTGARLADGTHVSLDALVVAPKFVANADLLAPFGLTPVEVSFGGQVIATRVAADPGGATSVPGIYVAGNVTDPQAQVITSAAAGLMAGAAINMDLVAEDARHAVTRLGIGQGLPESPDKHGSALRRVRGDDLVDGRERGDGLPTAAGAMAPSIRPIWPYGSSTLVRESGISCSCPSAVRSRYAISAGRDSSALGLKTCVQTSLTSATWLQATGLGSAPRSSSRMNPSAKA
jgi:thioredoxin reductase